MGIVTAQIHMRTIDVTYQMGETEVYIYSIYIYIYILYIYTYVELYWKYMYFILYTRKVLLRRP